jgi:hypothetical protein
MKVQDNAMKVQDNATLSFYATKDGKISVSYQGWDATKTVLAATACAPTNLFP